MASHVAFNQDDHDFRRLAATYAGTQGSFPRLDATTATIATLAKFEAAQREEGRLSPPTFQQRTRKAAKILDLVSQELPAIPRFDQGDYRQRLVRTRSHTLGTLEWEEVADLDPASRNEGAIRVLREDSLE